MKLQDLNTQQLKAVQTVNKPVLVFAGAGSGKTRVLTYKVWHLIKENLFKPNEILALTFTNKAAAEMKVRIQESISCDGVNVGTFHSIGARMLRMHIASLNDNYNSSFTIYDTVDQKSVIKEVIENLNLSEFKELNIGFLKMQIDKFKNANLSIKDIESKAQTFEDEKIAEVYKAYCDTLKSNNALDFNDLLLLPIRLLKENKKILDYYQNSWKYVLVDEFQDTNSPQFEIVSLLAGKHQNITVVGDDDQSIYSWRGAEIKNFLEFDQVYENTKVIRLEQNYRSSQNILSVASNLISNNQNRVGKTLITTMDEGDLVKLNCFKNGKDEAVGISDEIEKNIKQKYSYNNIAILVRAIFQTREFEERFLKIGMPYRILGGTKFYERAEIKDCVAYLRLINQEKDDLAFERIVNNPKRSIGDNTLKNIHKFAKENNLNLERASIKMLEQNLIKPKAKIGLNLFINSLSKWRNDLLIKKSNHIKLLQIVLDESGYSAMLKNKKDVDNENRLENIKELLN